MKKEISPFGFDPVGEKFFNLGIEYEKSLAFLTALELDIFSIIGEELATPEEVSMSLGCPVRGVSRLLNALVALGLLEKNGQKFSNTKEGIDYLVRGSPNFIGDLRPLRLFLKFWLNAKESILQGSPISTMKLSDLSSKEIEGLLYLMNWRANRQASEFVRFLDLSKVMKALDFGCGSGTFGLELLKVNINIELVLFDYPEITPFTEKYVERKGFSGLVKVLSGDLITGEIGNNYDLAIVSNVLRYFSFKECLIMLNKIFDSLNRKGKIVVMENPIDNNRTSPLFAAMDSLRLFLFTPNGDLLTETEIILLLKEAWFSNIQIHKTSFNSTIFIGEK